MEYRRLGRSGLEVSEIGLGTNAFGSRADRSASIAALHCALDLGVTLIDTADVYSGGRSEEVIGEGLRGRRQDVVLATKAGFPTGTGPNRRGGSRQHIVWAIEESLARLQTDYIDLYQVHLFDPSTPLDETLRALDDLVRQGKVRYIGTSNYAAWQLALALGESRQWGLERFESIQVSYSLLDRTPERELQPLCMHAEVSLLPYFPLAGGILTGKYGKGQAPEGSRAQKDASFARRLLPEWLAFAEELAEIATEVDAEPAALAVGWVLRQPAVASVLVGATSPEQVERNLAALEMPSDDAVFALLDERSSPYRDGAPFASYRME